MRCPDCGAHNPDAARWCGQCLTALAAPEATGGSPDPEGRGTATGGASARPAAHAAPDDAGRDGPDGGRSVTGAPTRPPSEASDARTGAPTAGRDIRERDGEVEWRCPTCDGWSPLGAASCARCGAARTGFGEDAAPSVSPEDGDQLVAWSLLLPGLGHVRAGRTGSGLARAVVALAWLLGGLALGIGALRVGSTPLAALPLLLGAAAVWVATALDVRALVQGRARELLDARGLLWLVAGVTGLLVVVLVFDTMRVAGG